MLQFLLVRPLLALILLAVLAGTARATWSIVVVDTATGEVGVAAATCVPNADLRTVIPVIVVGEGAAASQAFVVGTNKPIIWTGFQAGDTPAQILAALAAADPQHQCRQFGIVNFDDAPVSFTGSNPACVGDAQFGVTGTSGSLRYAIQGNVLTDDTVVLAAETALLSTSGDLGQRLMAAMEAARALGGDGRCSCSQGNPTGCGAPPVSFNKSAFTSMIQVARIGDVDGACTVGGGCANGSYYLSLAVKGNASSPLDPVVSLQNRYDTWRTALAGRPDHLLSSVELGAQSVPANGWRTFGNTLRLIDVDGVPLTSGGASVTVTPMMGLLDVGPVIDNGDGTYTFGTSANGPSTGLDRLRIVVDDGSGPVQLHPDRPVFVAPPAPLHCARPQIAASAATPGGTTAAPLTLDMSVSAGGAPYAVLASASGTVPGTPIGGGLVLPLNFDAVTQLSILAPGAPFLPGSFGTLGAAGRATPAVVLPNDALPFLVGLRFDFAAIVDAPAGTQVTNAVGFDVVD